MSYKMINTLKSKLKTKDLHSFTDLLRKNLGAIRKDRAALEYVEEALNKHLDLWNINNSVDVMNSLFLMDRDISKYFPIITSNFKKMDDLSYVKSLHLLSKYPSNANELRPLYKERLPQVLSSLKNNPQALGVIISSYLHISTPTTHDEKNLLIQTINEHKWQFYPKHSISILSYSTGDFQLQLIPMFLDVFEHYVVNDMIIND